LVKYKSADMYIGRPKSEKEEQDRWCGTYRVMSFW